jgi:hypothetical protein
MSHVITCPSGLTGRVRGMKVREERILADRALAKQGGQVDALLAACWEETLDPGPYGGLDGKVAWTDVLQGDRLYALIQIRSLTYGPMFDFKVACQQAACRATITWELDLGDLVTKELSETSRAAFAAGNRFETKLPGSWKKVGFRLLVGADERKLPQLRRQAPERVFSSLLAHRVLDIEGVDAKDKRAFLEDLPMRDASFLLAEFDRVDCGVETSIDIACPECGAEQAVELPFGQPGFFMPSSKPKGPARSASSPG